MGEEQSSMEPGRDSKKLRAVLGLALCLSLCLGAFFYLAWDDVFPPEDENLSQTRSFLLNSSNL